MFDNKNCGSNKVASYRIIDARYAYEYDGGHIRGAENYGLWDEERFFQASGFILILTPSHHSIS